MTLTPRTDAERRRGGRRRRFLSAALAVCVLTVLGLELTGGPRPSGPRSAKPPGPAAVGPPAQPPPAREEFGASVNWLFLPGNGYTPREVASQLGALRRTGATIARTDALWPAVEPTPPANGVHRYDWHYDDRIATALASHGIRWLPILDYSPGWTESVPGRSNSPPKSPTDYAAFAAAFAERYGPRGGFWREHAELPLRPVQTYEIWNEPDSRQFWSPEPDAARYVELYLYARNAITAVDPGARVIVGGLTSAASFIPSMLRARPGLIGHVDGIAIHPYGSTPQGVLAGVRRTRNILIAAHMSDVPLYVTEFGWVPTPAGALDWVPERLRPRFISRTVALLGHSNCGIAVTVLYTWVNPKRPVAGYREWYGINPSGGGSSPDSLAFARGLRIADRPAHAAQLCGKG